MSSALASTSLSITGLQASCAGGQREGGSSQVVSTLPTVDSGHFGTERGLLAPTGAQHQFDAAGTAYAQAGGVLHQGLTPRLCAAWNQISRWVAAMQAQISSLPTGGTGQATLIPSGAGDDDGEGNNSGSSKQLSSLPVDFVRFPIVLECAPYKIQSEP